MPIYEYRCPRCEQTFERLTRFGTSEAPPCPTCGAAGAERLISVVARPAGECGPSGST